MGVSSRVVGKLSEYVKALSAQLASYNNVDVNVVTYEDSATGTRTKNPRESQQFECQTLFEPTLEF